MADAGRGRPLVANSWRRSAEANAPRDASRLPPVLLDRADLLDYREGHVLARLLPLIDDLLGAECGDVSAVYTLADARGTLLWVRGDPATRRRAERINFVEGAGWSETQAGTNALGTVLAVREPLWIAGSEHFHPLVRAWTCVAAPIRDPGTGRILGVVDVTGGPAVAGPHALALLRATARAAEITLSDGPGAAPAGPPPARLRVLGTHHATLEFDGRESVLRPRHGEILLQLALAPDGLTGPQLAVGLSEDEVTPVTLRAEISRLRSMLGTDMIGSNPYRLRVPVRTDVGDVLDLLARGRVAEAVAAYPGPPLPCSDAPAVVDLRQSLARRIRTEVLRSADAEVLHRWVSGASGIDDAAAWRALADLLPGGSARRSRAAAQARALREGNGTATLPSLASKVKGTGARAGLVRIKA
ncbi:MAG TPA: GAF domain-containing protein [Actinospica sp.]|jgi:hypothetical protein|nr:GAF domain-containing protein [Actinospica sp.]